MPDCWTTHTPRIEIASRPCYYCSVVETTESWPWQTLRSRQQRYAIVDYARLNPELGSESDYTEMVEVLHGRAMGQIVDVVPNHMSATPAENMWWTDVLENGPASPHATYFDIDWRPVREGLSPSSFTTTWTCSSQAARPRPIFLASSCLGFPIGEMTSKEVVMAIQTPEQLASRRCAACEGGVPKFSVAQAMKQLETLAGWMLIAEGRQIRKDWRAKDFLAGMTFLDQVAELAEREGHHPDLHLEDYRHVWIALWTHAVDGLSENDFILAAKIDQIARAACIEEWEHECLDK
jgi:4a-hydroxytetrahydrobiopterin dehydratase